MGRASAPYPVPELVDPSTYKKALKHSGRMAPDTGEDPEQIGSNGSDMDLPNGTGTIVEYRFDRRTCFLATLLHFGFIVTGLYLLSLRDASALPIPFFEVMVPSWALRLFIVLALAPSALVWTRRMLTRTPALVIDGHGIRGWLTDFSLRRRPEWLVKWNQVARVSAGESGRVIVEVRGEEERRSNHWLRRKLDWFLFRRRTDGGAVLSSFALRGNQRSILNVVRQVTGELGAKVSVWREPPPTKWWRTLLGHLTGGFGA